MLNRGEEKKTSNFFLERQIDSSSTAFGLLGGKREGGKEMQKRHLGSKLPPLPRCRFSGLSLGCAGWETIMPHDRGLASTDLCIMQDGVGF